MSSVSTKRGSGRSWVNYSLLFMLSFPFKFFEMGSGFNSDKLWPLEGKSHHEILLGPQN